MFETIKKQIAKHNEFIVLAFSALIMLPYLWCGGFFAFGAQFNILSIMLGYFAWRGYRREKISAAVIILLSGIAVILPFWSDWSDAAEMLFSFALILWPVPVTCLIGFCLRKFVKNDKLIFAINTVIVFLLAAGLHLSAEGMMEESWSSDLEIPALWLTESLLWSAVLLFNDAGKDRRKKAVQAWLVCLVIFYFSTFMEASYLSSPRLWDEVRGRYWAQILFLFWPVFLTVFTGALCARVAKDKPHFVQKVSVLYFSVVLLLCWLLTDISINFALGAFRDDICRLVYLLLLAEFVIWKEVYGVQAPRRSRIGALAFLTLLDAGTVLYLLARNERLREVLYYIGFPITDGSLTMRAQWRGYRKAAAHAFFTNNLSVLDSAYTNESYYMVVNDSHGLASIRFYFGMLPMAVMVLLLSVAVAVLWRQSRDGGAFSKCAGYFAFGCLLKMTMSLILQMNMVVSPYIEFPFTGTDIPEFVVLALLLYEGRREERGMSVRCLSQIQAAPKLCGKGGKNGCTNTE